MIELFGWLVGFGIVFGIPYLLESKGRNRDIEKNSEEFMKRYFGDDYKDKINR